MESRVLGLPLKRRASTQGVVRGASRKSQNPAAKASETYIETSIYTYIQMKNIYTYISIYLSIYLYIYIYVFICLHIAQRTRDLAMFEVLLQPSDPKP